MNPSLLAHWMFRLLPVLGRWCLPALALASGARAEFSDSVVDHAKESTVRIINRTPTGSGTGTGFIVNKQGHVVTNFHVVQDSVELLVVYGRGTTVWKKPAAIVATSPEKDLAILDCGKLPDTRPLTIANRETKGGQEVMALGFPGVLDDKIAVAGKGITEIAPDRMSIAKEDAALFDPVAFLGSVGKEMPIESGYGGGFRAIAHDAKISEGNSGGPLIDRAGRLVGVNVQGAKSEFGIDYAFSIHASELVALARAHSIPIDVTSSKAPAGGSMTGLHLLLYLSLAAFAVVLFLMVLRKPRAVMVDAMSRVVRSKKHDRSPHAPRQTIGHAGHSRPQAPAARGTMRLRGRDMQGISYDLAFSSADFERGGGRLVIGRNNDLSQLVLSQDSVSRQHATLLYRGGSVQVEDRNSGNGTRVNGRDLAAGQPAVPLHPGDKLTLGEVDLVFEITP